VLASLDGFSEVWRLPLQDFAVVLALHESTRRVVCRIAFLACCVAPTIAVAAWAMHARSPGRIAQAERELAGRFELAVSIDEIEYPRPETVLYSGIVLKDPVSGRVVAEINSLEATRYSHGVALVAPSVEIDAIELAEAWRVVDRLLRVGRASDQEPLRIAVERLTLHGAGRDAITLANVSAQLQYGEESSQAGLRFTLPGGESGEPVLVVLQRSREAEQGVTRLSLRTGGTPIPLAVARTVFPALAHLGMDATFTGQVWASRADSKDEPWDGEVVGRFSRIDLDALVARQFPHKLSGVADITLQKFAFADGRITKLVGRLEAGPGVIGRSLLEAASASLGMRSAARGADQREMMEYEQLAATFDINGHDARIQAACPATRSPNANGDAALCVIRDEFGPMLLEADTQPQPSLGLARLLVPRRDVLVPASRETETLLKWLPIPVANASTDNGSPRATLRDAGTLESSKG
jgi:hypothetical protein